MNKILYCDKKGNPAYTASFSNDIDIPACPDCYRQFCLTLDDTDSEILSEYFLTETGALVRRGLKPSAYHEWEGLEWYVPPASLAKAKEDKCAEVNVNRTEASLAPILFEGVLFDADELSQKLIEGLAKRIVRGAGLTEPWLGWKVTDNSMVWSSLPPDAVYVKLCSLTTALEDRYNALLVRSWVVKAQIHLLTSIEDVIAYIIELETEK